MPAQNFIVRTDNTDMSADELLLDIVDSAKLTLARIKRDEVTVTEWHGDLASLSPQTSILPWRVKHNGTTVAAAEKPLDAAQIMLDLADDLSDNWLVTFEMGAI